MALFGCGGGGGGGTDPSFYANIENDRRKEAMMRDEALRQLSEFKRNNYNIALDAAKANAGSTARNYASSIGINPDSIADLITQITNDMYAKAPRDLEGGVDPNSFFTTDQFASGFNDAQTRARTKNQAAVTNTFKPGFESTLLPDSDIDSIVDSILGEKQNLAQTQLDFQGKRGLLTPQGSEAARTGLGNQAQAARSTLSGVARGALDKNRGDILDIVSDAGSAASGWQLGNDPFDVGTYQTRVNDRAARERGEFGGDVRAALGNTELFDIPALISQAGISQGAQNLSTADNSAGAPGDKKKKSNTGRGLGSGKGF